MLKHKSKMAEDQVDTLVGPQVTIRGDLQFSGGLRIEGRVVGKVVAEEGQDAVVTLAENGSIEGEIHAPVVVINGRVDGDIHARERLHLASRARVQGNAHYKVVEMDAGSTLTGRLLHVEAEQAEVKHAEVAQFRSNRAIEPAEAEGRADFSSATG